MSRAVRVTLLTLLAALAVPAVASAQAIFPGQDPVAIPGDPNNDNLPEFTGHPASPHRVAGTRAPRHPRMAPNGLSNIHDDAFETDSYRWPGPLGDSTGQSSAFFAHECGSITFDSQGRLVSVCVGLDRPVLAMLDPETLHVYATMDLPPRMPSGNPFQDFSGGGYFYLDNRDRAVIPTSEHHLLIVKETSAPGFAVARDFDLTSVISSSDAIIAVMPDWHGRIWFVTRAGVIGDIARKSGKAKTIDTKEPIGNSFAVGPGGVFIVTDKAMYRLSAAHNGKPKVRWRSKYPNTGVKKPGQTEKGSGTTPTLFGHGYVGITDNADPMDVVVYKRGSGRMVCRQKVFRKGASDTDQSLVAAKRSLIAENNYGYTGPASTEQGGTTAPGIARVDIDRGGRGCHRVWTSHVRAPSVVPKLSLRAGLVYTYTKPKRGDNIDAWYFTALDFRTGKVVYKRLAGTGLGYNNNYAPVTLARNGTAYVGVLGGLVRLEDGAPG
jgi:hypothetical protein